MVLRPFFFSPRRSQQQQQQFLRMPKEEHSFPGSGQLGPISLVRGHRKLVSGILPCSRWSSDNEKGVWRDRDFDWRKLHDISGEVKWRERDLD